MKNFLSLILLFLLCGSAVWAQTKTISGTVYDLGDGSPLVGASVVVKGTTKGSMTDIDGKYTLDVNEKDKELVFSYMGMQEKKEIIGNRTVIDVKMTSDVHELDDVVVTALGIKRETKSLTVAQQSVNTKTLEEVRDPNIISSLSGKISGVQVTPPQTATGSARIVIRGNSSFLGNNQPLWVIDGMPVDNSAGDAENKNAAGGNLDMGNSAADLNPSDIESMEILKGPNAAALYGSRAANGVILITTKKAKEGKTRVSFNSNNQFTYISQWPDFQNVFGTGHVYQMVTNMDPQKFFQYSDDPNNYLEHPNAYTNDKNDPRIGLPLMTAMLGEQGGRSTGAPMIGQKYIGLDGKIYEYNPNPNNVKDFYQTAYTLTNNVAVEGGTPDNNFRVSYTNIQANDIVQQMNLVKKNNINARFYNTLYKNKANLFFPNISLDLNILYYNDKTENRQYLNGDDKNPIFTYINMARNTDLDELGKNGGYKDANGNEIGAKDFSNPYWLINENKNEDEKNRVVFNGSLFFQLMKDLGLNLRYGKDYSYTKGYEFRNMGANRGDKDGFYRDYSNYYDNQMMEFLLSYNKNWEKFSLVATFGGNRQDNKGYDTWQQVQSLKIHDFMHISNSNEAKEADKNSAWLLTNSLYGSVSLGFKSWVYLDLTGRNDWSSTLPIENCSFFYPSIGGSWIITDMLHISSSKFFGKVRGSWAQVGNATAPYRLLLYYPLEGTNIYGGEKYTSIPDVQPNSDLRPEKTTAYEIGADVRFFNGRLNVDFTYYYKLSEDQIVEAPQSPTSGFKSALINAGSMENRGVELSVNVTPVKRRGFQWDIMGNFTKNENKVLTMPPGLDEIWLSGAWNTNVSVVEGKPYGAIYGSAWAKDEKGNRLVRENGSPIIVQNVYLGSATPDFLLGISNRFSYTIPKGNGSVDLYTLLDIKKGGKIYSGSRRQGIRSGVFFPEYTSGNPLQERVDYWERRTIFDDPGDNLQAGSRFKNTWYVATDAAGNALTKKDDSGNDVLDSNGNPIYLSSGVQCDKYILPLDAGYYADEISELVVYDASYVKLRELSIGYNFPQKWIRKIHLNSARISAVGRNLWIIHQNTPKGLDPESASYSGNGQGLEVGGLPPTTTFGFDIKLTF